MWATHQSGGHSKPDHTAAVVFDHVCRLGLEGSVEGRGCTAIKVGPGKLKGSVAGKRSALTE
jgi:hypothetical protein